MEIEELQQRKHILVFKELIETLEKQKEELANDFHSEILPYLVHSKINIWTRCRDLLKRKFNPNDLEKDLEPLGVLSQRLRVIMDDLHPSLLKRHRLIKTFKGYTRSFCKKNDVAINLKYDEVLETCFFSDDTQLHIFKLMENVLTFFYRQVNGSVITIFISVKKKRLQLEFIRNENEKNPDTDIVESQFNIIQARLLILNAQVSKETDWFNFVQILIPFQPEKHYED